MILTLVFVQWAMEVTADTSSRVSGMYGTSEAADMTSNEGPESWSVYLVSLVWIWTDLRCSVYVTQLEGNGPV